MALPYVLPFVLPDTEGVVSPDGAVLTIDGGDAVIITVLRPGRQVVAVTRFAPRLAATIRPAPEGSTLAATAPAILSGATFGLPYVLPFVLGDFAGADVTVAPFPATLTVTTAAPVAAAAVRPTAAALAATTATPLIADTLRPDGASLAVTGSATTVTMLVWATPDPAIVTVVMSAPEVTGSFTTGSVQISPDPAWLIVTAADPVVTQPLQPDPATLTVSGSAPIIIGLARIVPPGAWTTTRIVTLPVDGPGWWTVRPEPNPAVGAGWFNRPGAQPVGLIAKLHATADADADLTVAYQAAASLAVTVSSSFELLGGTPPGFPYHFPRTFYPAERLYEPPGLALAILPQAPVILAVIVAAGASLTLTCFEPVVLTPRNILPDPAALTVTGGAATVLNPRYQIPTATTAAITGGVPTVVIAPAFRPSRANHTTSQNVGSRNVWSKVMFTTAVNDGTYTTVVANNNLVVNNDKTGATLYAQCAFTVSGSAKTYTLRIKNSAGTILATGTPVTGNSGTPTVTLTRTVIANEQYFVEGMGTGGSILGTWTGAATNYFAIT